MMKADKNTKSVSSGFGKDFGTGLTILILVGFGCIVIATLPLVLPLLGVLAVIAVTAGLIITGVALLGKVSNFVTGKWKTKKGQNNDERQD